MVDLGQILIRFVLFLQKVSKTIQGIKTRYRPCSRVFCFHPAQTVYPLKIFFCLILNEDISHCFCNPRHIKSTLLIELRRSSVMEELIGYTETDNLGRVFVLRYKFENS